MPKLEVITLKGEKEVWDRFSRQVKIDQSEIWKELKPFIEDYCRKNSKLRKFLGF